MSLQTELERAAAELKGAVERQDFARAGQCAAGYGELLQRAARELRADEAAAAATTANRNFERARRDICVARGRLANRLRRLKQAAGYRKAAGVHTWSVEG